MACKLGNFMGRVHDMWSSQNEYNAGALSRDHMHFLARNMRSAELGRLANVSCSLVSCLVASASSCRLRSVVST